MMQRGATASFMPNAVVFPGGVVHTSDEKLGHPGKVAAIRVGTLVYFTLLCRLNSPHRGEMKTVEPAMTCRALCKRLSPVP